MTSPMPQPASQPVYSSFASDPDYRELLELFVTTMCQRKTELANLFSAGDIDSLRVQAHQLKGGGGGYGFLGLTEAARHLEAACRADDLTVIRERLDELIDYIDRLRV